MDLLSVARLLAVLATGIAAGAMAGHTLLLGRFFNWVFESNRMEMFRQSYPVFVREKKPELLFDNLFTFALLVTTAYDVLLWRAGRIDAFALAAAGLQWVFVLFFFGSGFASLEGELLVKGNIAPEPVRRFLALNTRVTALSAILLLASLACLVL